MNTTARQLLRAALARRSTGKVVNLAYRRLPPEQKAWVHAKLAKVFARGNHDERDRNERDGDSSWVVDFLGRRIVLPLRAASLGVDWDNALSILGAEIEIKQTYAELLNSTARPELFVDVGASYGTHSLLHLAHGLRVVGFEPNPRCLDTFRLSASLNGFELQVHGLGLAERAGSAELWFPPDETWLGSTGPWARGRAGWSRCEVALTTLDDIRRSLEPGRTLLKLDTEGTEAAVIRGGIRLLEERRPWIIFETWRESDRAGLFSLLESAAYGVLELPLRRGRLTRLLGAQAFTAHRAINFAAIPTGQCPGGCLTLQGELG